jgi:hypothetical protein
VTLLANIGRYLWGFFVGDSFQIIALIVAFGVVALLAHPLGAWDGLVAFAFVAAVVCIDAWRRARPAPPRS